MESPLLLRGVEGDFVPLRICMLMGRAVGAGCWLLLMVALASGQDSAREFAAPRMRTAPGLDEYQVRSIVEEYLAERAVGGVSPASAMEMAPAEGEMDGGGTEVGQDLSMTAAWKNGLELSTKDKAFRVHVG